MTESEYLMSFHVMAKPNGAQCNLNCKYCFYSTKMELYQDKEMEMSDEVLEEYTRQYIGAMKIPEVTFAWQGGEPTLMGIEFFKQAIKFQEMYKKPGMQIYNTIQTNGTLLDNDWCEFFRENDFLVGISIDGPRDIHDTYRKDKKGNTSFEQVMHGLELLKKYHVEFNILSTVNRINAQYPMEVYNFFKEEVGAKYIQFIPIVELENIDSKRKIKVSDESVLPKQYGKFLSTIFDEWVQNDVGKVYVQIFDAALASWVDYPPSVCVFAPTCGTALIIEHNGDIYSCDHFVDSEHLLGNIMENPLKELVISSFQLQFGQDKADHLPQQCIVCSVNFACHGACPKHRIGIDTHGEPGLNYLCSSYKAFFEHIKSPMMIMASLFNQGRAPAEIMSILDENNGLLGNIFPDVERNDPCPCGSGLKYKKCHGKVK